ncbi:PilX N-terminal domain-containing pilus assembly protein [Geobacter argillaceus]|uniref:Tfp pilus assembly protein PilX n=1 Tax=Geobacter argillaceus TaxID=345631 RepID=A0A562WQK5_9BACT|nr:PilX N-terminal domain-containing pilus assembly protein [Geobacter argillaceus]TWJ32436.1 Tfp pilus assembly protein PilX [Geobacter argillaceus]
MEQPRRNIGSGPLSRVDNEQGAALIIVLIMLLLLIILGTTLMTSSVTEIKVAGNYRNNLETFFAADAAVEFAETYSAIYSSLYGTGTTWPAPGQGKILDGAFAVTGTNADPYKDYNQITIPGTGDRAQVKVELVKNRGNPPPGYGFQEDAGVGGGGGFRANVFAVTVIANGPNNARTDIESGVARMVPQ